MLAWPGWASSARFAVKHDDAKRIEAGKTIRRPALTPRHAGGLGRPTGTEHLL
jgi:hypothetical protein